jgi:NADH dehydrogenase (ubiquinone) 1 alpha subcomplex subunit 13
MRYRAQNRAVSTCGDPELGRLTEISRELQREKIWSRIHLVPLLLAEGDRDAYRRERAALAREQEIMKGVKDWEVRRYLA